MSDWLQVRLGDVATSFAGGTPSRDNVTFFGGTIPWVKSTEVNRDYVDHTEEHLTELGLQCSAAKPIKSGAVLMALYGATAGEVAMLRIDATANQAVLAITPADTEATPQFLYYTLVNEKQQILFKAQGSGQPNLSKGLIDRLRVSLPPLPEQQKIARILTTVDNLIEQTEALIEKYKAIKQGMMHDLFTRGVDSTGQLRPPYDQAPQLYKQSPLGWIPKEWEVETCNSLCREIVVGIVIQPTQYYTSWGVPVLRSANVRENGLTDIDLVFMSDKSNVQLSKSMVRTGDVVTVRTGYPGTSAVVTEEFDRANCVDIIISRPSPRIRSDFLCFWINSDYGKNRVLRTQGGLAQQHFNVGELKALSVAVPPMAEQVSIEGILLNLRRHEHAETKTLKKARLYKTGLMQDLLTGKVRVTVDEAEEVTADV